MFYNWTVWFLQQWDFPLKFWRVTKNNGNNLWYLGESETHWPTTWKEVINTWTTVCVCVFLCVQFHIFALGCGSPRIASGAISQILELFLSNKHKKSIYLIPNKPCLSECLKDFTIKVLFASLLHQHYGCIFVIHTTLMKAWMPNGTAFGNGSLRR